MILILVFFIMSKSACKCADFIEDNDNDVTTKVILSTELVLASTFQMPDEKRISTALKDIAYFLRYYKFNEWDRRNNYDRPQIDLIGYFRAFPNPSLISLHWKVYENCNSNFYKCITYLHSILETSPFARSDDPVIAFDDKLLSDNETLLKHLNSECKAALLNIEKTGIPFDNPKEKFLWQTTASYYMCWYTMLEIPELSMIGESCDNFANCLDINFGVRNRDPRADDRLSFSCAMYSFCPDPCCLFKHVKDLTQCYKNKDSPCFNENSQENFTDFFCKIDHKKNQNLKDIVANNWNISCKCNREGFKWTSQFGMCVDINECSKENKCNNITEDCLNLPGTFHCICKWGFAFDDKTKRCIAVKKSNDPKESINKPCSAMNALTSLFNYLGF